ncbi:MAG TPA: hypothetical protein PLB59_00670 [Bacteroidales bacterium]|nr:hypothetical protein [Bacteroidales bacterium]HNZ42458.1 hypothetical protein [Bacteroidales bacterium]HPB24162.1 hypothetical protein [Bacteroidales bacterium]HPI29570.1 hypothetical protein [Bacteroidales bacterium]HQN14759.1 hypothetical protein [Bacteroidales bacterium]
MKETNNDNRDVIQLLATVYSFIKRYFIILILAIICGIVIGVIKGKSGAYQYKKHLTVNSIVVPKEVSIDMIKSIKILVGSSNNDLLARKMNIPEDAAASIISIDTSTFRNKLLNIGFGVDIVFSDLKFSDTLSSGILYLFNNNEYYKKQISLFLQEKQTILNNINRKLIENGISKEEIENTLISVRSDNSMMVKTTSSDLVRLLEKKYETEKEIEFGRQVTIIEDTQGKISTGIGLGKSVVLYGLLGVLIGILLTLFIESLRLTRPYLRKK